MSRSFRISREIEVEATPEEVWQAIATRDGLRGWLWDQEVVPESAARSVAEPPRHLLIELPRAANGATQAFEYVIEAAGGTTRMRFVHSGFLGDDWDADFDFQSLTGLGWDMYLHTLVEYLTRFRGRSATYVLAQGPAASAASDSAALLQRALGVDGSLAAGAPFRLRAEGLPAIEGTVDYAGPGFLGVRTDGALYRFHLRSPMGMPVAVGHHVFADIDGETAAGAWRSWLESVFAQPADRANAG